MSQNNLPKNLTLVQGYRLICYDYDEDEPWRSQGYGTYGYTLDHEKAEEFRQAYVSWSQSRGHQNKYESIYLYKDELGNLYSDGYKIKITF